MSALGKALQAAQAKCMTEVLTCVQPSQLEKLMSSPSEVVETDNKCKLEQMMGVKDEMQTCVMKHVSKMEQGKEPEVTPEVCSNIGTGVKECVLKMKIDCFSKRENKVLTEIIGTAFEDAKEVYAMDEVQKGLEKKMSANQKKLVECALGSGSGSGRSSLMVGVFSPLLILFFMINKF